VKTVIVSVVAIVASMTVLARAQTTVGPCPADVQRETRTLPSFNRIEIIGIGNVVLRQGKAESATVDAPTELLSRVVIEVRDRILYVDVSPRRRWSDWTNILGGPQQTPSITIDFVRLDRVEAGGAIKLFADGLRTEELRLDFSGASTVRIANLQASTLLLDGSGATKIDLSGKVRKQVVDLSGAGAYSARGLESDHAEVSVSGAGKAFVNAKMSLSVEISGAGLVEYSGNPKLEQEISGVGKVRRREPD
jgi:Putative auto-transporter adhesin, head GIN domain